MEELVQAKQEAQAIKHARSTIRVSDYWTAQPRQQKLLEAAGFGDALYGGAVKPASAELIGYGGAAFGGKTEGAVALALTACHTVPGVQVGYFRRMFTELEGADGPIDRSQALYPHFGAKYNASKHVWVFPNKAAVHFCHCNNDKDRFNYQSQAFDILIFDEATHFSRVVAEYLVHTRNRPSKESQLPRPFFVGLTNPGNVGMMWYMQWFDILQSQGQHEQIKEVLGSAEAKAAKSYFIPAFVSDNQFGLEKDPDYPERLKRTDASTANALLNGDWTAFAGQAFPQWSYEQHTIADFIIPDDWPRRRACDYGHTHPFGALWRATNPANGREYIYRELYASKWTDVQQAEMIKQSTLPNERILYTFGGHDYWTEEGLDGIVTSHETVYRQHGVPLIKADINRKSGKGKIDRLLANRPDGLPGIQIFRTCRNLISIMPLLVLSETDPEDVKKVDGDDLYDTLRYVLSDVQEPRAENKKRSAEERGFILPF